MRLNRSLRLEASPMPVSPELRDRVFAWVSDDPERETSIEALALLVADDTAGLSDRFEAQLEFGTAGLRGLLGAGPNRMNRAVVRRTTAGLCAYLLRTVPHAHALGLVIARDGRVGSDVFAMDAARVAMGMGFLVHYFTELAPTPLCSYAVKDLGAAAGVMVTASHNPREYNGYKVYWSNAAQIIPPHDSGIAEAIAAIPSVKGLSLVDQEAGRTLGLFRTVAADVTDRYFESIKALDFGRPQDKSLRIAYTAMHGVGAPFARRALQEGGFSNVTSVRTQEQPDGTFPTVRFPNPEEPGAMDQVLAVAREEQADLVLANDPDADRLAVAYRANDGCYVMLSGNEIGILLGHHRLTDDPNPAADRLVVTTIVSSPMLGGIAKSLGVKYAETLTGFKWIANAAISAEAQGTKFVFGYEEALGSSTGDVVRDKDGVGGALVVAHVAAQLKAAGLTIGDRLDAISQQFGVYVSGQHNATYPGAAGAQIIQRIMGGLRGSTPWTIGTTKVLVVRDYETGKVRHAGGDAGTLDSPPSNVLTFDLEGGDRIVARPSGTEPKIKYYFDVRAQPAAGESLDATRLRGSERLAALKQAFVAIADSAAKG
jgi:phosphomannomutase